VKHCASIIHLTQPTQLRFVASSDMHRNYDQVSTDQCPVKVQRSKWAGRSVWYATRAKDRPLGKLQVQPAEGRGFKSRPVHQTTRGLNSSRFLLFSFSTFFLYLRSLSLQAVPSYRHLVSATRGSSEKRLNEFRFAHTIHCWPDDTIPRSRKDEEDSR